MTRGLRTTMAAGVLMLALVISACAGDARPVVTVLPTGGTAASTPTPTATFTPLPQPSATVVTIGPPAPVTPPPPPPVVQDDGSDCGGAPVTLTDGSPTLTVGGVCPDVRVQGEGLTVDLAGARVGTLTIEGSRVTLRAGALGSVTVRGNDVRIEAASADRVQVQGDRGVVTLSGSLGSAQFDGNDNTVRAGGGVGPVADNGSRNAVG